MLQLVEQWQQSSMSRKVFCEEHSLKLSTFDYWIAQKRRVNAPDSFITLVPEVSSDPQQVELSFPNGVRVKVSADVSLIAQLIHVY